jgi:hypothetical protein
VSGRLLSFYFGGSKLVIFLAKIEQIPRILLYFVNRRHARSSKCAKIGLSMTVFYYKDHLNFSKIDFHLKKLCPIFRLFFISIHKMNHFLVQFCPKI